MFRAGEFGGYILRFPCVAGILAASLSCQLQCPLK